VRSRGLARHTPEGAPEASRLSARRFQQPGEVLMKIHEKPHQHEDDSAEYFSPCDWPPGQNAIDVIK
jgi:hypothetical protein